MKKLPFAVECMVLLPLFYSGYSSACTFSNGASQVINNIQFGTVSVARDTPVGTIIARVTIPGSSQIVGYCSTNPFYKGLEMLYPSSVVSGVYSTPLQGVGMKVYVNSGAAFSNPINELVSNTAPVYINNATGGTHIELIKTGDIVPGRIPSGNVAQYTLRSSTGTIISMRYNIMETVIQTRSCSVLNSAVSVNLGTAQRRENFTGPGSTSNKQAFSIPLNCDANTPVSITLDTVNSLADEANGVLSVNSGSTAQGVGVQVLYNDTPVKFGQLISYGNASGGNINIPFDARLYQTDNKVFPGSVNSTATFTMTYR